MFRLLLFLQKCNITGTWKKNKNQEYICDMCLVIEDGLRTGSLYRSTTGIRTYSSLTLLTEIPV